MAAVRGAIFDVDGTLVDSNEAHAKAFELAFAEVGTPVPLDALRRLIGMGGDQLIPAAAGYAHDSPRGERVRAAKKRHFDERFLPRLQAFHHARALLERLRAEGWTLVTATSAEAEELEKLLAAGQLTGCFEAAASASDARQSKPAPDIVLSALDRLHLPAERALMLGDTPYDLAAARQAGVGFVAFRSGGWRDRDFDGAIAVYDGPADLLAHFEASPFGAAEARSADAPFRARA